MWTAVCMMTRAALLAAGKAAILAPRKHVSVVACRSTMPHISLGAACPSAGTGRTPLTLRNVPLPCSWMSTPQRLSMSMCIVKMPAFQCPSCFTPRVSALQAGALHAAGAVHVHLVAEQPGGLCCGRGTARGGGREGAGIGLRFHPARHLQSAGDNSKDVLCNLNSWRIGRWRWPPTSHPLGHLQPAGENQSDTILRQASSF